MARPGSRGAGPGSHGATNLDGPGMPVYAIADADPSGMKDVRGNSESIAEGVKFLPHAADDSTVLRKLFGIDVSDI